MAASSAETGYSATFGIYNGSTYDLVAEVVSIKSPNYSREAVDATHLSSDDGYREFIAGIRDAGEVSITLNYLASASDALIAAIDAGTDSFQITSPGSTITITFSGICTAYDIGEMTVDDKITATATFKISGKPTLA